MAEVTVRLDDIEIYEGTAKSSGRAYTKYSLKAGGRKYVTFKREIAEPAGLLKGQVVTITYDESQNGDYTNYDLTKVESGPQEATGATKSPSQPTLDTQSIPPLDSLGLAYTPSKNYKAESTPEEQRSIARAVAFKGAVALAENGAIVIESPEDILRVAESFVPWLLNTTATASPPTEENPFAGLSEEPVDAKGELVKF